MKNPKVAVIIHAHTNFDVLEEILYFLENIPGKFDLFLNFSFIDAENKGYISRLQRSLKKSVPGNCYFTTSENRGQDLGGFFASTEIARQNNLSYDLVCKVHTKRNDDQFIAAFQTSRRGWRQKLLNTYLGSDVVVRRIWNVFKTYPGVGMFCDQKFYTSWPTDKTNHRNYIYFSQKLGLQPEAQWPHNAKFLAGTMFWMRGDVWDFLMEKPISIKNFEIGAAHDGLRAHAFERIFDAVVRNLGYHVWLSSPSGGSLN